MKFKNNTKKQVIEQSKGITLIALVITIIVLLILAGVSIATLTGENGILTQAGNAKKRTKEAQVEEEIELAIIGSYGQDGKLDKDKLNNNLKNIKDYTAEEGNKITKFPAVITINGDEKIIFETGTVMNVETTVEKAKEEGTTFNKETTLIDSYENPVIIPEGFKIASDSATEVAQGVVIEDTRYTNTKGSQFVWIPVGTVTGTVKGVKKTETIKLSRYTFDENGKEIDQGSKAIYSVGNTSYNFQELSKSNLENEVATDIEEFKSSANNNCGYYIGRYEAGLDNTSKLNETDLIDGTAAPNKNWTGWSKQDGTKAQIVCKQGQQVWNYITQNKASELSKNMYSSDLTFTSDLINSYAWDTAILFIQKFGEETNSSIYSRTLGLSSTNTSQPQTTGTNILKATSEVDKQCNIFDMAGNTYEWSTETFSASDGPCVARGGDYTYSNGYTSCRYDDELTCAISSISFRPILYL